MRYKKKLKLKREGFELKMKEHIKAFPLEKLRLKKEEYLTIEDNNIKCEDGIVRLYEGNMYGLIKKEISQTTFKKKFIWVSLHTNSFNAEIEFVKEHPNIEFIKTVNIDYNGEKYSSSDDATEINLNIEFWFSKAGKFLIPSEIVNVQKIRNTEHTFHLNNNDNYKKYFETKEPRQYGSNSKLRIKINKSLIVRNIFSLYKINNIYFIKNNYINYNFCLLSDYELKLFSGKINGINYKEGISDSKKNFDIEKYVGYTARRYQILSRKTK